MRDDEIRERYDPLSDGHSAQVEMAASLFEVPGRVLDVGTGDGRNALYPAAAGWRVDAFDIHSPAIERAQRSASLARLEVAFFVADAREFEPRESYDLVVCHGLLHFLVRDEAFAVIEGLRKSTTRRGVHSLAFFSNAAPVPSDLQHLVKCTFPPGEVELRYPAWEVVDRRYYILNDEHEGGVRHVHSMGKLVTRSTHRAQRAQ